MPRSDLCPIFCYDWLRIQKRRKKNRFFFSLRPGKKVDVANEIVFLLSLCVSLLVSVINIDGEEEVDVSLSFYSESLDPSMRFEDKKPDGCFLVGNVDSDREKNHAWIDGGPPEPASFFPLSSWSKNEEEAENVNQSRQLGRKLPNGKKAREDWGRGKRLKSVLFHP